MSFRSIRVVILDLADEDSVSHVSLETQDRDTRLLRKGVQEYCNEDDALALASAEGSA
jgi:hypothetical protein